MINEIIQKGVFALQFIYYINGDICARAISCNFANSKYFLLM